MTQPFSMHPDPIRSSEFYASVPTKRLMAWIVDTVITLGLAVVLVPFTAFTALFYFPFLWLVVSFAYRTLTLSSMSSTLGMRLMSIELRDQSGQRLDFGQALLHTLGYSISIAAVPIQILSVIFMAGSAKGQGLTDLALNTVMINRR